MYSVYNLQLDKIWKLSYVVEWPHHEIFGMFPKYGVLLLIYYQCTLSSDGQFGDSGDKLRDLFYDIMCGI